MSRLLYFFLFFSACPQPDPTDDRPPVTPPADTDLEPLAGVDWAPLITIDIDEVFGLVTNSDGSVTALAFREGEGDDRCPDCNDDLDACDVTCRVDTLVAIPITVESDVGTADGEIRVHRYAPADNETYRWGAATQLPSGEWIAGWQICPPPPLDSCDAFTAVFNGESDPTPEPLWTDTFGDLELVAHPTTGEVLLVRSSNAHTRAGVWFSIRDGVSGDVVADWTRIGSSWARRVTAVSAGSGRFDLYFVDEAPLAGDDDCPVCTDSSDCTTEHEACDWGGTPGAEAGLVVATLPSGAVTTLISSWSDDGSFGEFDVAGGGASAAVGWYRGDDSVRGVLVDDDLIPQEVLNRWVAREIPIQWATGSGSGETGWWLIDQSDATASELLPRVPLVVKTSPEGTQFAELAPFAGWLQGHTLATKASGNAHDAPVWYVAGQQGSSWSVLRIGHTPVDAI